MGAPTYRFGRNWQDFLANYLTPERLAEAKASIAEFCGPDACRGRRVVDVGCGSGLFSLAAHELGAARLLSFDVDADSVACCQSLWSRAGRPPTWEVRHGSVLDGAFVEGLGQYDLVYAWGVLHHTGRMWEALGRTAELVAPGGSLHLALYNRATGWRLYPDGRIGPSTFWAWEKRTYVRLPRVLQAAVDGAAMGTMVAGYLLTGHHPGRQIAAHRRRRGMAWSVDIRDWLGGYPYEYASVAEVTAAVEHLGLVVERVRAPGGLLNNEFRCRRPAV